MHDIEIGNELFYYIFEGDSKPPELGFINLNDDIPGLGLKITDKYKSDFKIIK